MVRPCTKNIQPLQRWMIPEMVGEATPTTLSFRVHAVFVDAELILWGVPWQSSRRLRRNRGTTGRLTGDPA